MTVIDLRDLLANVIDTSAEVRVGHEDDNFFDGEVVTGLQIIHNFVDGKNICRIFIVSDPYKTKNDV